MGRNKKYLTKEEKAEAQRRWVMEHYERNKKKLQKINLERYYEKKNK